MAGNRPGEDSGLGHTHPGCSGPDAEDSRGGHRLLGEGRAGKGSYFPSGPVSLPTLPISPPPSSHLPPLSFCLCPLTRHFPPSILCLCVRPSLPLLPTPPDWKRVDCPWRVRKISESNVQASEVSRECGDRNGRSPSLREVPRGRLRAGARARGTLPPRRPITEVQRARATCIQVNQVFD